MPVFGLDNMVIGVIFFIFALQCFLITRNVNSKRKTATENVVELREGVFNGALTVGLCIFMGLYFLIPGLIVAFIKTSLTEALKLPYPIPTGTFAIYFLGFLFIFFSAFAIYELKTKKYLKEPPPEQKIHKLDLEISRKAFHVLIIGVLAVYLIVGQLVVDSLYGLMVTLPYDYWGYGAIGFDSIVALIDGGKLITMFGVTIVFELVLLSDLIRIKAFRWYPVRQLGNLYREKEKDTLGPQIYLVAGILFAILVFPPPIAMAVIAISGLGDAAATIVGVTKGKHRIRPGVSKKTWEGCLAGMVASFVFGFIGFIALAFSPAYFGFVGDIGRGIIIGLVINGVAVPAFFLIDYFTPKPLPFSDNLLNPIIIGFTMWGIYGLFCL